MYLLFLHISKFSKTFDITYECLDYKFLFLHYQDLSIKETK